MHRQQRRAASGRLGGRCDLSLEPFLCAAHYSYNPMQAHHAITLSVRALWAVLVLAIKIKVRLVRGYRYAKEGMSRVFGWQQANYLISEPPSNSIIIMLGLLGRRDVTVADTTTVTIQLEPWLRLALLPVVPDRALRSGPILCAYFRV